jgi:hypothetical protein
MVARIDHRNTAALSILAIAREGAICRMFRFTPRALSRKAHALLRIPSLAGWFATPPH